MKFPSLDFILSLQEALNGSDDFFVASRWSDVKVLLCFGEQRYWMKLYGGKVIDVMEYFPMANPLGWDYMISGSLETWNDLRQGKRPVGHLLDSGDIAVDGDLLQANRLYESTHLTLLTIRDLRPGD
jgi:hypothetical protein